MGMKARTVFETLYERKIIMEGQTNLWGIDPEALGGKVGRNHPETSQKAAKNVRSGSQQAQVVARLYLLGEATAHEIADHVFNKAGKAISPNQCATRLLELREKGLVEYCRDPVTGRPIEKATTLNSSALLQRLTGEGRLQAVTIGLAERRENGSTKTSLEVKRVRSDTESFT